MNDFNAITRNYLRNLPQIPLMIADRNSNIFFTLADYVGTQTKQPPVKGF